MKYLFATSICTVFFLSACGGGSSPSSTMAQPQPAPSVETPISPTPQQPSETALEMLAQAKQAATIETALAFPNIIKDADLSFGGDSGKLAYHDFYTPKNNPKPTLPIS